MAQLLAVFGAGSGAMAGLSTISTIAGPVLGVMSAVARVAEGNRQAEEYNRQAREERVTASIQAARQRRDARVRQSRDRTLMLEGGALSGTAADVLRQNKVADEMDAMTTIYSGEQRGRSSEARGRASRVSPLTIFSAAIEGFNQIDPLNIGGRV
jgi:hypothetical protein